MNSKRFKNWYLAVLAALCALALIAAVAVSQPRVSWLDYVTGTNSECLAVGTTLYCAITEAELYASRTVQHERYEDGSGQWVISYCVSGALCAND